MTTASTEALASFLASEHDAAHRAETGWAREVVYRVGDWAVMCRTTAWATTYSIAVLDASGDLTATAGYRNEPLSHLLATFAPEVLAHLRECHRADAPDPDEPEDLTWLRQGVVLDRIALDAADPTFTPALWSEGAARAFEGVTVLD